MDQTASDLAQLESVLRSFFQTMKRPQRWTQITEKAGVNIDRPAGAIVHLLMDGQQYRLQDLAHALAIEAPSASRKTQELEKAGYLERLSDPKDGRAVSFRLTSRGLQLGKNLRAAQRQFLFEAMQSWSAEDRQTFTVLFERFSHDITSSYQKSTNSN